MFLKNNVSENKIVLKEILPHNLCNTANAPSTPRPFPFYATQIINHFLKSMISANYNEVERIRPIVKSLYPLLFLYCKLSFILIVVM